MDLEQSIITHLKRIETRRLSVREDAEAAVLLAIQCLEEVPHFLLTRRTETVATHKGQISFPGGVREPGDATLVETALREAQEEIGLKASEVRILGEFHDYLAVTDLVVRPVIGIVAEKAELELHPDEVQYILRIPVGYFLTHTPAVEKRVHRDRVHNVYFYDFNGETVWGLTARMIRDFLSAVPIIRDRQVPE